MSKVMSFIDHTLSFFLRKKRNKKALEKALPKGISFGHGSVATDYLPYTLFFTKNPKLACAQTE